MEPAPKRATICDTNANAYRHWHSVTLRYGDTDRQGHINNAVYCTLFESGRIALLFDDNGSTGLDNREYVIARISLDYLQEMNFPGIADIGTKVLSIGNSSFLVGQAIFKDGVCHSTAESVVVLIERESKRPVKVDGVLLAKLQAAM